MFNSREEFLEIGFKNNDVISSSSSNSIKKDNQKLNVLSKEKLIGLMLVVLALVSACAMCVIQPIIQDGSYHNFVDSRRILGIPNCRNVLSNFLFVIIGFIGLYKFKEKGENVFLYKVLFLGVLLVGIGSGYYHLNPNSYSLVWDRLPMTLVFMTLFSIIISEFVSNKAATYLWLPLILIGGLSVCYWVFSESGDLRLYVLVQFYPMVAILAILVFFIKEYSKTSRYWVLLSTYMLAKFLEYFDTEVFGFLGVISGHSLKHCVAALGLCYFLLNYNKNSLVVVKEMP